MIFEIFNFLTIFIIQLTSSSPILSSVEAESKVKAKLFLDDNILIDGHNDWAYMLRVNKFDSHLNTLDLSDLTKFKLSAHHGTTSTDLNRLREGRVGAVFWAAYVNCDSSGNDATVKFIQQIDLIKRLLRKYPDYFQYATSVQDIRDAFRNKKIASLIGIESGHAIESSLAVLRMFYDLGARYMTLTYNCNLPWATGQLIDKLTNAFEYGGLNEFGRKVVAEMNRLGMMVDLSHTSHQTQLDALDASKSPVIFSHSSVHSICNHTRNVRDDVLFKLKENRGIIMINAYGRFVRCDTDKATIHDYIKHFNYVKNLIGVDYVGIGSDFDGVDITVNEFEDVSQYPNLIEALRDNGWSDDELKKVAGENLMRVFAEVENYAKSINKSTPIEDLIPDSLLDLSCRVPFD